MDPINTPQNGPSNNSVNVVSNESEIPNDTLLTNILLPNKWILYLYDKQLFKKMTSRPNFQAKPYKELYTISTVNELMYILKLMEVKVDLNSNAKSGKINLDMNNYIIMRQGIEPIWEDPKNSDGGTFTVKMDYEKGYEIWSLFVMYILGETLTNEMEYINGITVSYVCDAANFRNNEHRSFSNTMLNDKHTYIKIWDGKENRNKDNFINALPIEIINKIKNDSLQYLFNKEKKDFEREDIISKLNNNRRNVGRGKQVERGGFSTRGRR